MAPEALLDDGLLDILLVRATALQSIDAAVAELRNPTDPRNRFTLYRQEPWLEADVPEDGERFLNLDGEPFTGSTGTIRFEVLPRRLPVILPEAASPLLQQSTP